jgi:hypothetical protein
MMPLLQHFLHHFLRVEFIFLVNLALNFHQKPAELIRSHMSPTFSVLVEQLTNLLWRHRLS